MPFVDHASVGVADLAASMRFYDAALAPLGARRRFRDGDYVAWGTGAVNGHFAVSRRPYPMPQNAAHTCFAAGSREEVAAFHAAALAAGGTDNGQPGYRPQYSEDYYGAYVLDPDGNHLGVVARLKPESASTPRARIIDHLSIGTDDLPESSRFYDALLAPLGVRRLRTRPDYVMYGTELHDTTFILAEPDDLAAGTLPQPGFHACFSADSRESASRFHAAGLRAGARDNGAPGHRPDYAIDYWGAFLIDPWGNRIGVVARVSPDAV